MAYSTYIMMILVIKRLRFMVRCRLEARLAATSPAASLFGVSTLVTVLSAAWMARKIRFYTSI